MSCHLVLVGMSALHQSAWSGHDGVCLAVGVVCTAIYVLIVGTDGGVVAFKQVYRLPQRNASHGVLRAEEVGLWSAAHIISVVDLVSAKVVVHAQCSVRAVEMVFEHEACCTARYPLFVFKFRLGYSAWIAGIEVSEV